MRDLRAACRARVVALFSDAARPTSARCRVARLLGRTHSAFVAPPRCRRWLGRAREAMARGTGLRPACLEGSVDSKRRPWSTGRRQPPPRPTLCSAKTSRRGLYFGARHEGEGSDMLVYGYEIFVLRGFDARHRKDTEPAVRASPTCARAPTARSSPERDASPWNGPRRPPVRYPRRSQSATLLRRSLPSQVLSSAC